MSCPEPIATILIDILKMAMLRIRLWGQQGEARKCVYEADHVHNLPALLTDYRPELLAFYWNTERPLLIQQLSADQCAPFQPLWSRLAEFIPQTAGHQPLPIGPHRDASGVNVPIAGRETD